LSIKKLKCFAIARDLHTSREIASKKRTEIVQSRVSERQRAFAGRAINGEQVFNCEYSAEF
jgi:hypothetical protein